MTCVSTQKSVSPQKLASRRTCSVLGRGRTARPVCAAMSCCLGASRCIGGDSGGSGSVKERESLMDESAWKAPVYNKSPAAEAIITKALEANILMKELSVEDRTVTLDTIHSIPDLASDLPLTSALPLTSTLPQPTPLPRPTPTPTPIPSSPDADEGHGYRQVQAGSNDHQAGRRGR